MRKHVKVQDCPVVEDGLDCFHIPYNHPVVVDIPDWKHYSMVEYWKNYKPESIEREHKPYKFNSKQSQAIKAAHEKRKMFESNLPLGRLIVVRHNRGCTLRFLARTYKIPEKVLETFLNEQQRNPKVNLHLDETSLSRVVAFVEPMCKQQQRYYDRRRRIERLMTRRWHRELEGRR